MASLDKLLDTLWFARQIKLITALPASWWENAKIHKIWGKPISTLESQAKLDAKFAPMHARKSNKPLPAIEMDGETDMALWPSNWIYAVGVLIFIAGGYYWLWKGM